jgi:hypothetical protein
VAQATPGIGDLATDAAPNQTGELPLTARDMPVAEATYQQRPLAPLSTRLGSLYRWTVIFF